LVVKKDGLKWCGHVECKDDADWVEQCVTRLTRDQINLSEKTFDANLVSRKM